MSKSDSPLLDRCSAAVLAALRLSSLSLVITGLDVWAIPEGPAMAQPPSSRSSVEDDEEEKRAHRLTEMRERIMAFKVFAGETERNELPLVRDPIFRFTDPARASSDGTIWAWGEKGRPSVLITIERYETFWSYEMVSLTAGQLQVARPDGERWRPTRSGIDLKPVRDAPIPTARQSARLRQMRDIARRFALSETYREQTYELRLFAGSARSM